MKYQCNDQHLGLKTTFPIKKDVSLEVLGYFKRNQSPDIYLRCHGTDICQILSGHDIIGFLHPAKNFGIFVFEIRAQKKCYFYSNAHFYSQYAFVCVYMCVMLCYRAESSISKQFCKISKR